MQGRVVYDAGSIILEESKDMSDLSANNSVTANNASFSKKASFLSEIVSKSSNNGSSHEVEE